MNNLSKNKAKFSTLEAYPAVGMILNNRYKLLKVAGNGGMGRVYKALDLEASKVYKEEKRKKVHVAIKVLLPELSHDNYAITLLKEETLRVQRLQHENIIAVYDFDTHGDWTYIKMEWLEGKSLDDLLREKGAEKGFSLTIVKVYLRDIAKALMYAHKKDIIHCDIKPENIFLTPNNRIVLIDFGLAHEIRRTLPLKSLNYKPVGTVPYMTPQSLRGGTNYKPSATDDIYALSVTLYQLLTGELPYSDKICIRGDRELLAPKKPRKLTEEQWQILKSGFAYHSQDRVKSVNELLTPFFPKLFPKPTLNKPVPEQRKKLIPIIFFGILIGGALGYWGKKMINQERFPNRKQQKTIIEAIQRVREEDAKRMAKVVSYLNAEHKMQLQKVIADMERQSTTPEETKESIIRQVQTLLNDLQCGAGNVDGKWGEKGRKALAKLSEVNPELSGYTLPNKNLLYKFEAINLKACLPNTKQNLPPNSDPKNGINIAHYIAYDNGTALDTKTGLLWQRCTLGETWNGSRCTGIPREYSWQEATELSQHFASSDNWHLPTINEFASLVQCRLENADSNNKNHPDGTSGCTGHYQKPTINTQVFPLQQAHHYSSQEDRQAGKKAWVKSWYWTSSSPSDSDTLAWSVHLYDGSFNKSNRDARSYVRLVRHSN